MTSDESDEDMEEGGAGGTRKGTLLILLRKFVLAVLVVIVTMVVLSDLGVDIGPMIAGAGIVGIFVFLDSAFRFIPLFVCALATPRPRASASTKKPATPHPKRSAAQSQAFGDTG